MDLQRVVCVSRPGSSLFAGDVLQACRDYPSRITMSGVSGKVLCFGDQFALLLEGGRQALEGMLERIEREAPEAGLTARAFEACETRAFSTLALTDIYLDEIHRADPLAGVDVDNLLIDLFCESQADDSDESIDAEADSELADAELVDSEFVEADAVEAATNDAQSSDAEDAEAEIETDVVEEQLSTFAQLAYLLDRHAPVDGVVAAA